MRKKDVLKRWRELPDYLSLSPVPVEYKHEGPTFDQDGIRITGSMEWIEQVLARLKPLLDYESEEGFAPIADRLEWPLKIKVYKHAEIDPDRLARNMLDSALEHLDEEYADPNGGYTEPTEAMKEAALVMAKVIVDEYLVWGCEPTGEVLEFTREDVEADYGC